MGVIIEKEIWGLVMEDLLIKDAKLVSGKICNIIINNKKITNISTEKEDKSFKKVIDLKGKYFVSPGWIDVHCHCFNKFELYSDDPDIIGYKTGVTTVVDAGTSGAENIDEFYEKAMVAKTNVYAFINLSKIGIKVQSELADTKNLDDDLLKIAVQKYNEFIVGIKVRMSKSVVGQNGILPLVKAKGISKELEMPVMVHIGSEPPVLKEVLDSLEKGDILSHIFNGKENGILDLNKEIKEETLSAKDRGVIFDIAHGKDSFNFEVAKTAMTNEIKADTISTDIYKRSRVEGPVFNLFTTMEKFLAIGYTLQEVIDMVTINPAKAIGIDSKGRLQVGCDADITIFDLKDEEKKLVDSNNNIIIGKKTINPKAVVLNGEYIEL